MALALNIPWRLICHKTEKPKQGRHKYTKNDLKSLILRSPRKRIWWEMKVLECWIYLTTYVRIPLTCPVGWGCRIHWLLLCRRVRPPHPTSVLIYDTKQSDGEVPILLELWGRWSTPLLPLLPGLQWLRVEAPDKGPIYGLNRTKLWFLDFTVFCI